MRRWEEYPSEKLPDLTTKWGFDPQNLVEEERKEGKFMGREERREE
jgi:hypothetical protein